MANLVESPRKHRGQALRPQGENRIAIVEAAESLIPEGGYGALNAKHSQNAQASPRRTIFNHFASVDDVLVTRMNQYFNRIFENATSPSLAKTQAWKPKCSPSPARSS